MASITKRSRRPHTRSRTGCVICRRRHLRCDEHRPQCLNCRKGGRPCDYDDARPLLIDVRAETRGKQPWNRAPWAVKGASSHLSASQDVTAPSWSTISFPQPAPGSAADPFDSLAIGMPFRSMELFRYFHQATTDTRPTDGSIFASVPHDAPALRSVLLIAATHYAWDVGNMGLFRTTYYHHKIEMMQTINEWLQRPNHKLAMQYARQIATLVVAEFATGSLNAAETHFDGLIKFISSLSERDSSRTVDLQSLADQELTYRYLVLTFGLFYGCKNHLYGPKSKFKKPARPALETRAGPPIETWNLPKLGGHGKKMKAISGFPYFFVNPASNGHLEETDVSGLIQKLRELSGRPDPDTEVHLKESMRRWGVPDIKCCSNSEPSLLDEVIQSHISSFYADPSELEGSYATFTTSWSAFATATSLYLHSVLGLWDIGKPLNPRLLRHFLSVIKREVERAESVPFVLDFWMVYVGALSLSRSFVDARDGQHEDFSGILEWCKCHLRKWSEDHFVTQWKEAWSLLNCIAWPVSPFEDRDGLATTLWYEISGQ